MHISAAAQAVYPPRRWFSVIKLRSCMIIMFTEYFTSYMQNILALYASIYVGTGNLTILPIPTEILSYYVLLPSS